MKAYIEIEVEVEYDYQPAEMQTPSDPGCEEAVTLTQVEYREFHIYLTPEDQEKIISQVWDHVRSEKG